MQNSTIQELLGVLQFLAAEAVKLAAIYRRMVIVFREDCVSDRSAKKCSTRFCAWHESLVDDPRQDQVNTVITADITDKVDDLLRSDRCVTLCMLVFNVDVNVQTLWTIDHERLHYQKMCAGGFRSSKRNCVGARTSASVSVSQRPRTLVFSQSRPDRHK